MLKNFNDVRMLSGVDLEYFEGGAKPSSEYLKQGVWEPSPPGASCCLVIKVS